MYPIWDFGLGVFAGKGKLNMSWVLPTQLYQNLSLLQMGAHFESARRGGHSLAPALQVPVRGVPCRHRNSNVKQKIRKPMNLRKILVYGLPCWTSKTVFSNFRTHIPRTIIVSEIYY